MVFKNIVFKRVDFFVLLFMSTIYGVGEALQLTLTGPNYIRWHMSDFGFPFYIAAMVMFGLKVKPAYSMLIGGCLGIASELIQFSIGTGDPIDILAFTCSMVVGWIIILILSKHPSHY